MDKIQFAKLISLITTFKDDCALTGSEIEEIDQILSDGVASKVNPGTVNELLSCMLCGNKIEAIRHYRMLTGSPLKDSKTAVEAFWTYSTPAAL
jgi:ribosomal protein L7/L12